MKPWQKQLWQEVIDRDEGLCIYCGRQGCQVHHVTPRSRYGKESKKKGGPLWQLKNMCCVCLGCNGEAHTREMRISAMRILRQRFNYAYDDVPWAEYGVRTDLEQTA